MEWAICFNKKPCCDFNRFVKYKNQKNRFDAHLSALKRFNKWEETHPSKFRGLDVEAAEELLAALDGPHR
jgi:hypothetical protein